MKLSVLGSGSKGNAIVIDDLLVDVGLPYRTIWSRLKKLGITDEINNILISHRHEDHCRSIPSWVKYGAMIHCTRHTVEDAAPTVKGMAYLRKNPEWAEIKTNEVFRVGDFEVVAVPTDHGCSGAVTFFIKKEGRKVAMFLETGEIDRYMWHRSYNARVCVIESNHDSRMNAENDTRGEESQRRTAWWHLNNEYVAYYLKHGLPESCHTVILTHLSVTRTTKNGKVYIGNNDPELVRKVATDALRGKDVRLIISSQDEATEVVEV